MQITVVRLIWPPPKGPDQDSAFCVVSRTSTELIFCIHGVFHVRNVYKQHRLGFECCRDISAWKTRMMKPNVLRDPGRMKPTEYRDEANWFSNWTDEFRDFNRCSWDRLCLQWMTISYRYLYTKVLWSAKVASLDVKGRRILIYTIKRYPALLTWHWQQATIIYVSTRFWAYHGIRGYETWI